MEQGETAEKRLLKMLTVHVFPSVLEPKNVVGDDDELAAIMTTECIQVLASVEPLMTTVFVNYCGSSKLEASTSISLKKLNALFLDTKVNPELLELQALS